MNLLREGGPQFMYPLLVLLLFSITLIVVGLLKPQKRKKISSQLASLGLFAIVFGFLGQTLGLINVFDGIQKFDNITPQIMAGGLKISFLTTGFGALVFLVSRFGILLYSFMKDAD